MKRTADERFSEKYVIEPSGCWLWTGATTGTGRRDLYGQFFLAGRTVGAHRFAFERAKGAIPAGLVIDHLCRVTLCVNPDHLRAVTNRENVLSGEGIAAQCARRTGCVRGHSDWQPSQGKWRRCRTCRRADHRKYKSVHRDEVRAKGQEHYLAHRDEIQARRRRRASVTTAAKEA